VYSTPMEPEQEIEQLRAEKLHLQEQVRLLQEQVVNIGAMLLIFWELSC
jgi:hypothetical protein